MASGGICIEMRWFDRDCDAYAQLPLRGTDRKLVCALRTRI